MTVFRQKTYAILVLGAVLSLIVSLPIFAGDETIEDYYKVPDLSGITLNVVINASLLNNGPALEVLANEFEEQSGAKINYIPLPENQMYDKVRLELLSGSGRYDMMHTGAGGAKDFGTSGFLVPFPYPPDSEDFFSADMAQYTVGNKLYGLPMVSDTNILYWRTDLFEAAGLEPNSPPETYDEYRDMAIKLTGNGVWGSAFKGIRGLASTWEWYNYLYAWDGEILDDNFEIIVNQKPAVDSLQWVADNLLRYKIYPPDTLNFDYSEYQTLFLQGKVAMGINWPSMWSMIQDPQQSEVVGKVDVGRKPRQVRYGGNIGGWSWNVFKVSKSKEAAIAFAKFMSTPRANLVYAELNGNTPVRKSVMEQLAQKQEKPYKAILENMKDGQELSILGTGSSWMPIEEVLQVAIQEALIGEKSAQQALDEAAVKIKQILEKNKFYEEILPQFQTQ